ncbi:MAG: bifunctional folylpolyglutamate synthase/dihydrofolate synthase [Alphaproteobacteria bacterium]|nr:bifunctional folylpolyglutamate synthase/dihydrofolate synthase [Alphaproteobacteria bacterium]MCB9792583.1 bifunctional folylpolyglutamate synthase/dihydrofolate synthase [Alphaproteobacteria bacterium]
MIDHPALKARVGLGIRLGLDRVQELLSELGDPHLRAPVLHVGGTNGKGSVTGFLETSLLAQGFKVGATISPHLSQVNERIRVDSVPIGDAELSALLDEVDAAARRWGRARLTAGGEEPVPLTYFELLIVAAFLAFARAGVDVVVAEVGMGGRLDATNIVQPAVTAVVTVSLDHCDRLGPDVGSIAAEKAGILKRGVPMVLGRLPKEAMRVMRPMAAQKEAPLLVLGEDFEAGGVPESAWVRARRSRYDALHIGMAGKHQVHNAAVAVQMLECLGERHPELGVGEAALRAGLRGSQVPGRCEWLAPELLVDGAHNVAGAEVLAAYLRSLPRDGRRTLLLGASEDKDVRSVAAALAPEVDRILTTSCAHPRAMSPGQVAEALVGLGVPVMPAGVVEEALPVARAGGGQVVAAGSLFLVGAVRDIVAGR